jgi:anhydro-N-acetylmuramic acid kinase
MSGSSLDGLDMAFVHLEENAGQWTFEISETFCKPYTPDWKVKLSGINGLLAKDYLLLHTSYGHWLGHAVNDFMEERNLNYRVQIIASHGHTAFHEPAMRMTAQLGDGAAIAAVTGIRTITDFRSVDLALGGQGAPVVPIGEKLLFPDYDLFLNVGGIANISARGIKSIGFDVCPANRILNLLAAGTEKGYDDKGLLAAAGNINEQLLEKLNGLNYYRQSYPKSLSNEFGLNEVYPLILNAHLSLGDALATYVEHIATQIAKSLVSLKGQVPGKDELNLLITGGGAHNLYLIERIKNKLSPASIKCIIPSESLVDYKEALIIALMGALRWREDVNVLHSVTGATKDSINGAVWSV